MRETKQTAFFASVDFDLIPKVLTITAGTRHFRFDNSSAGSVLSSFGCFEGGVPPGGCQSGFSFNLNAQNLQDTESGYKSRGNLTWHITPDVMVYYTFSQGFRPGGFNQNGGVFNYAPGPVDGVAQYAVPKSYSSDKLANNEIGWKTEFLDHRLQWNGAVYRETWDNVQVAFFDPGVTGNIFFDTNGQNFLIKGIETSFVARVVTGLTLQGAASTTIRKVRTSASRSRRCATAPAPIARRSPTRTARSVPRAPMRRRFSSACAPAMTGASAATLPTFSSAPPTAAIHSPRRAPIPLSGQVKPSVIPGDGSRIPLTRPTTPRSGWRRMPGT